MPASHYVPFKALLCTKELTLYREPNLSTAKRAEERKETMNRLNSSTRSSVDMYHAVPYKRYNSCAAFRTVNELKPDLLEGNTGSHDINVDESTNSSSKAIK